MITGIGGEFNYPEVRIVAFCNFVDGERKTAGAPACRSVKFSRDENYFAAFALARALRRAL